MGISLILNRRKQGMGGLSPTTHGLCSHVGIVGSEWQLAYLFLSPTGPYKNHVVCHHIIQLPQKR